MLQTKVLKFEVSNKALMKDEGLQYPYLDVLERKLAKEGDIQNEINKALEEIDAMGKKFVSLQYHNVVVKSKLHVPDLLHMYATIFYK